MSNSLDLAKEEKDILNEVINDCCCNAQTCGTNNCDRTVDLCCTFTIPNGFFFIPSNPNIPEASISLGVNTNNVQCIVEPCTISLDPIPNPCTGSPDITGCTLQINKVRLVGCFEFFANLGDIRTSANFFGNSSLCCMTTVPVNNIICYTCKDDPCPGLPINSFNNFSLVPAPNDPCGNKVFKFSATVNLNQCTQ